MQITKFKKPKIRLKFMTFNKKLSLPIFFTRVFIFVFIFGGFLFYTPTVQAAAKPDLGTAADFAIISGTTITNTGATSVTDGDVGGIGAYAPAGLTTYTMTNGTIYPTPGNATTLQAQADAVAAVAAIQALANDDSTAVLAMGGGKTWLPGVHQVVGAATLAGTATLDAQGDPNAVFIFKITTTFTTAASSIVELTGDAQACNVFWVPTTAPTLGINSTFKGTLMSPAAVIVSSGANV